MCFSVEASFGAGIVLTVAGIATLKKVELRSQIMFASIPLVFAAQQFTEGFVWIALTHHGNPRWQYFTSFLFLFFAQVVWPVWVSLSMALPEKNPLRRKVLFSTVCLGVIVSSYSLIFICTHTIYSYVEKFHIVYSVPYSDSVQRIGGILYFICSVVPSFVSGIKRMWSVGLVIFISLVVTKIFFNEYQLSVWCFFAAVLSALIYFIMAHVTKHGKEITE